jgi:DNA-binding transcriptional regulator LsrR (DeoR family)
MGPDELFQRAVIARRYYLEGRTRVQIAQEFGLSRFKVARMLDEAIESGMVEIRIHNPGAIDVELSTALDHVDAVARAMAELLQSILRDGDVVGVDCGRTLTHIAPYLTSLPRCDVVQLTGMAGPITSNGTDLVRRISEVSGGESWPLYAPLVVTDARTAQSLAENIQIRETIGHQESVSCALVSVGAWTAGASQVYESLTADEARSLDEAGVCAETCALLLNSEGQRVPGLDERRMGIDESVLRAIPTRIAIAAGKEKVAATKAVLKSGLVSSLVTDIDIATAVLD